MTPLSLAPAFRDRVAATWPAEGADWLDSLPALLAAARERWRLSGPRTHAPLSYNYVEYVTGPAGEPLVLKAGVPREEANTEIAALTAWAGRGAVRVVASDAAAGLLLIERLVPGDTLASIADDAAATAAAAALMRELHRVADPRGPYPTVERWGSGFGRYRREYSAGDPLPADLVDAGEDAHFSLCASQGKRVLLHGDLHHENILRSGDGWACIDPKGVVGEREYECGALLRNPASLYARPDAFDITRRRASILCDLVGFDIARVWQWSFAQAVLSACWCVEDGQDPSLALRAAEWFARSP